jgi:hypothetical protein
LIRASSNALQKRSNNLAHHEKLVDVAHGMEGTNKRRKAEERLHARVCVEHMEQDLYKQKDIFLWRAVIGDVVIVHECKRVGQRGENVPKRY